MYTIIKWFLGIVFSFLSINAFTIGLFIAGICFLLMAIICIPNTLDIVEGKINMRIKSSQKYLTVIVLFTFAAFNLDKSQKVTKQQAIDYQDNSKNDALELHKPTTKKKEKLPYKIIHELSDLRVDGGKNYFVLLDDVDLSGEVFKERIKATIDDITEKKGGKIGVDFLNDRGILELVYKSHYGSNQLGRILSKSEVARVALSEIASFDGQLTTGAFFNTLYFFPGASGDNPVVGKFVDVIEYNP